MTQENIGNTPEDENKFDEITRRTTGHYALEGGQIVFNFEEADGPTNLVDLPDDTFCTPDEVVINGKKYVRRNLDEEGLTTVEMTLEKKVKLRDDRVQIRIGEILAGAPVTDLPKAIQTEKGVSKAEKDAIREDVDALVRSHTEDSIIRTERARRRSAALISEGYEIPERAVDEYEDIDYSLVPSNLRHTSRKPDGLPVAKEI